MKRNVATFGICLFPALTFANVMWPGLLLTTGLVTWSAIGIGLLAESIFVWWLFSLKPLKAIFATVVANAVSTVLGIGLVPISTMVILLLAARLGGEALFISVWAGTVVTACLVNAFVEGAVYRHAFKIELRTKSREFFWLAMANAFSTGAAIIQFWPKPGEPAETGFPRTPYASLLNLANWPLPF